MRCLRGRKWCNSLCKLFNWANTTVKKVPHVVLWSQKYTILGTFHTFTSFTDLLKLAHLWALNACCLPKDFLCAKSPETFRRNSWLLWLFTKHHYCIIQFALVHYVIEQHDIWIDIHIAVYLSNDCHLVTGKTQAIYSSPASCPFGSIFIIVIIFCFSMTLLR